MPVKKTHFTSNQNCSPPSTSRDLAQSAQSVSTNELDLEFLIAAAQNLTTEDEMFLCKVCGQSTPQKDDMKRHIAEIHLPKTTKAFVSF